MLTWQRRRGFKILVSLLLTLMVSAYFLPTAIEAYRVQSLEDEIMGVLEMANLAAGESAAVEFAEQGSVTIGDRVYKDDRLPQISDQFFNDSGVLVAAAEAAIFLVASEMPTWIPSFMLEQPDLTIGLWILSIVILLALVWNGMTWAFILVTLGAFALTVPFWVGAAIYGRYDSPPNFGMILGIAGIAFLSITFALFTRLIMLLLGSPTPVFAIAQSVVREAVRLKISVGFIVILVVVLPLLPLGIDDNEPLRYQLQTYLSRSISVTFMLLACMTLVLGCATVAFEIRDRQIWQVMTKPVSRLSYLFGKWIGIVSINTVGMITASIAIFISVEYMKTRPAQDALDELAVRSEVLTARAGTMPEYRRIEPKQLRELVDSKIDDQAELSASIVRGDKTEIETRARLAKEFAIEFSADQRKIAPGESKTMTFEGLKGTLKDGSESRLRFLFHCGASDTHEVYPVIFAFPKTGDWTPMQYVPTVGSFLRIPSKMIDEDGTLQIQIINASYDSETEMFTPPRWTLNWDIDDLEVLYKVSDFEMNFFRAMLIDLFKLAFLGVLAVSTGAFLSFPVACMLSFAIFIAGSIAPFLGLSLSQYAPTNYLELVIASIAEVVNFMLNRFGEVRPAQMLVEGRLIPWSEVGLELFWLIVIWSGVSLAVGYLAFRRKELAIYSGQG
jgi:ABC-type transport system involved in multi-copper enzyme maturation permease subunit